MTPTEFANKAISRFTEEIPDNFFLFIQNDNELLQDYLDTLPDSDRQTYCLKLQHRKCEKRKTKKFSYKNKIYKT